MLKNKEIEKIPSINHFWPQRSLKLPKEPESKIVEWFLKIGVNTNPVAKNTLSGKTKFNNSGENSKRAMKIFSGEIFPTSA